MNFEMERVMNETGPIRNRRKLLFLRRTKVARIEVIVARSQAIKVVQMKRMDLSIKKSCTFDLEGMAHPTEPIVNRATSSSDPTTCLECYHLRKELNQRDQVILELKEKLRLVRAISDDDVPGDDLEESVVGDLSRRSQQRSVSSPPSSSSARMKYKVDSTTSDFYNPEAATRRWTVSAPPLPTDEYSVVGHLRQPTQAGVNIKMQDLIDKVIDRTLINAVLAKVHEFFPME